jgi:hypothetical protein
LHIEISPALFVTATIIIITAFSLQSWFIAKIARGNSGQENFDKAVQGDGCRRPNRRRSAVRPIASRDRLSEPTTCFSDLRRKGKKVRLLSDWPSRLSPTPISSGQPGWLEPPHFRASPAPGQSPEADHDDDVEIDPRDL